MNVYSIEIKICATAYIKAENEEAARKIAQREFGEQSCTDNIGAEISEEEYDSPGLPEASLSPAVTYYGPFEGGWDLDLVEENVPTGEGDDDGDEDEDEEG